MSDKTAALAQFCSRFGADFGVLSAGNNPYTIENVPAEGFDGQIQAVRVFGFGRFGNRFYQSLTAVLLARHLGLNEVQLDFETASGLASHFVPPIRMVPQAKGSAVPTLAGIFFTEVGFETILEPFDATFVADTIRAFIVPFHDEFYGAGEPLGDDVLAMHFRSGDIFGDERGWVPSHYVLPPASYYTKAAEHALANRGVRSVRIVYEDDRNPTIAVVADYLARRGIPFTKQSSSLATDIGTLLSARHMVGPFGTFCEAIAMLSHRLVSYYGFRQIESHQYLHRRERSMMEAVLAEHDVRMFLVEDAAGEYIPPFGWQNTESQLEMMRSYPQEALRLGQRVPIPHLCWSAAEHAGQVALAAARREAALFRRALERVGRPTPPASERRNLEVDFTVDGNSRRFIGSGWSTAERGFTWTMHRKVSLSLPLADWNCGYRCVLHLLPHIRPPLLPTQEMIVSIRGIEIYRIAFNNENAKWTDVSFDIPASAALGADALHLDFTFPLAVAPITFGDSNDLRVLGVAVRSLRLEQCET